MFTTVRQYRCDPAQAREIAHLADEKFADKLAEMPGFAGYEMVNCGDGMMMTITVFEDRESAMRSNDLAAEFVRAELGGFDLRREGAYTGEVLINRAGAHMSDLVHA